jgi:hypothetical protein
LGEFRLFLKKEKMIVVGNGKILWDGALETIMNKKPTLLNTKSETSCVL